MVKARRPQYDSQREALVSSLPNKGDGHAISPFQLSLKFRSFASLLQKLHAIHNAISAPADRMQDISPRDEISEKYSSLAGEASELFNLCGDNKPVYSSIISEWLNADLDQTNNTEFAQRVNACGTLIERSLAEIPRGPEKALIGAREAFLFAPSLPLAAVLARHPEAHDLADLADACDPEIARHPEPPLDAMFLLDLAAPHHGRFEEAVSNFRKDAIAAASDVSDCIPQSHILPVSGGEVWLLHLAPRRTQLRLPLFAPMRALAHNLVSFQTPMGYWTNGTGEPDALVFASAGIAHSLSVFGDLRTPAIEKAYRSALTWLEDVQRPDGGWPIRCQDARSDLITTALAGDFLRRSGRQRSFDRAAAFLIRKQHLAGLWFFGTRNADAYNAIILEVLESWLPLFPQSDHRLDLALGLFAKAEELAREEDEISDQLALIAAHHAAEMLSYSVLEALSPPGDIWDSNLKHTIGLRLALSRLEERLQADSGEALRYRSQMQRLAAVRDEIVHKGGTVARSAVRSHLGDARSYLSAVSLRTLGYDLLG